MSIFNGSFSISDRSGTQYIKVRYRLAGDSVWTSYNIAASGTTYSFTVSNNLLYDIQTVNVNGADNPSSAIIQDIAIMDPNPIFSPTNVSLGYSFANLSGDIDTYSCTIALFSSPGSIIATHVLSAGTYPGTVSDTFTGLTPTTEYIVAITPTCNQFFRTFTYTFTTEELASCAAPTGSIATLV